MLGFVAVPTEGTEKYNMYLPLLLFYTVDLLTAI
jgi:hypothetical protein